MDPSPSTPQQTKKRRREEDDKMNPTIDNFCNAEVRKMLTVPPQHHPQRNHVLLLDESISSSPARNLLSTLRISSACSSPVPYYNTPPTDFESLPLDVALHILSFFSPKQLIKLSNTSPKCRDLAHNSLLWNNIKIDHDDTTTVGKIPLKYFKKLSRNVLVLIKEISILESTCRNFYDGRQFSCSLLWICKKCTALQKLQLDWCGTLLNDDIITLTQECKTIRQLTIDTCGCIDNDAIESLKKRHPNVRISIPSDDEDEDFVLPKNHESDHDDVHSVYESDNNYLYNNNESDEDMSSNRGISSENDYEYATNNKNKKSLTNNNKTKNNNNNSNGHVIEESDDDSSNDADFRPSSEEEESENSDPVGDDEDTEKEEEEESEQ